PLPRVSPSRRRDYLDVLVTGEVRRIERQNPSHTVDLHRGHQAGIVCVPGRLFTIRHDKTFPFAVHIRGLDQHGQELFDRAISFDVCWWDQPSPFWSTGRVATFQNSVTICGVMTSGSPTRIRAATER